MSLENSSIENNADTDDAAEHLRSDYSTNLEQGLSANTSPAGVEELPNANDLMPLEDDKPQKKAAPKNKIEKETEREDRTDSLADLLTSKQQQGIGGLFIDNRRTFEAIHKESIEGQKNNPNQQTEEQLTLKVLEKKMAEQARAKGLDSVPKFKIASEPDKE
jgi:hypothetical protein